MNRGDIVTHKMFGDYGLGKIMYIYGKIAMVRFFNKSKLFVACNPSLLVKCKCGGQVKNMSSLPRGLHCFGKTKCKKMLCDLGIEQKISKDDEKKWEDV